MSESLLGDRVRLHCGDCRDVLATLAENSLDACVTDPPYHLHQGGRRGRTGADGSFAPNGFMGKLWDGGDVAFRPETWAAVYRVLKPGAHLVAMGGTRTYHRLACAIEDAGFEIRDTVSWLYGSGFPKSHDVSKGIDRAAGAEREIVGSKFGQPGYRIGPTGENEIYGDGLANGDAKCIVTTPATDAARQWQGWGTALKPSCELCVLARKPLSESTVVANVLRWGTGAINVDGCRVEGQAQPFGNGTARSAGIMGTSEPRGAWESAATGRWPANLCHDGSAEVVAAFPESEGGAWPARGIGFGYSGGERKQNGVRTETNDSGSAARFFYTAKADADDRLGSKHPTVKPLDLMQWLVRLVTPKNGTVLDCFAGTGTTAEAAWREGMAAVLIEAEPEYQADIRRRMALALAGPDERQRESIKAKNLPRDDGPLFALQQAQPAQSESWAEMWAKPFDFSQEPSE